MKTTRDCAAYHSLKSVQDIMIKWTKHFGTFYPLFCLLWIGICWGFVRFVHHDSQYQLLSPDDYQVEVISQGDFQNLTGHENHQPTLSSSQQPIQADLWQTGALPYYKAVKDNSHYTLVTVKGTGPFVHYWEAVMIPIFFLSFIALVGALKKHGSHESEVLPVAEQVEQAVPSAT